MPFRDLPTACGFDTLVEIYEQIKYPFDRIAVAVYKIEVKWECEF